MGHPFEVILSNLLRRRGKIILLLLGAKRESARGKYAFRENLRHFSFSSGAIGRIEKESSPSQE